MFQSRQCIFEFKLPTTSRWELVSLNKLNKNQPLLLLKITFVKLFVFQYQNITPKFVQPTKLQTANKHLKDLWTVHEQRAIFDQNESVLINYML